MELNFYSSNSDNLLPEIDTASSPTTVYIRKNFQQKTEKDIDNNEFSFWTYEEAAVSRQEYEKYKREKNEADIAYLYMVGGLEYA